MHQSGAPPLLSYLVIALALGVALWRNLRPQKLRISRLWILPAMLVVLAVFAIAGSFFEPGAGVLSATTIGATIIAALAGIAAGVAFGRFRGAESDVQLHESGGAILVQQSPLALGVFFAAFIAKFAVRQFLPNAGPVFIASSDGFLLFAITSVIVMRWHLYQKYKQLH